MFEGWKKSPRVGDMRGSVFVLFQRSVKWLGWCRSFFMGLNESTKGSLMSVKAEAVNEIVKV